jgi:phosphoenolpyruvate carboxylase
VTDTDTAKRPDGASRDDVRGAVDTDLRADVSFLGSLLGRVLTEAGGPDLLADVERLRAAVISAYEDAAAGHAGKTDSAEPVDRAGEIVAGLDQQRAEQVARAFTVYFHLSNLAEEHHRVRVLRRRRERADSLPAAVERLVEELGAEEASARLQALRFQPVFTAHPTEARRRAVASTIRRISDLLDERDAAQSTADLLETERRLLEEIDVLWRTSPLRTTRPTPLDEVRTAMNVFDQTLFEVVPHVYRVLDDRLNGDGAGRQPVAAATATRTSPPRSPAPRPRSPPSTCCSACTVRRAGSAAR